MNKVVLVSAVVGVAVLAVVLFFVFRKNDSRPDSSPNGGSPDVPLPPGTYPNPPYSLPKLTPGSQNPPYMFDTKDPNVSPSGLYGCTLNDQYHCTNGEFPCPYQLYDDGKKGNWRWRPSATDANKCVPPPDGTQGNSLHPVKYGPGFHLTQQRF